MENAENETRHQRHDGRKQQDPEVDLDFRGPWNPRLIQQRQSIQHPESKDQSRHATEDRKENAFRQELPNDAQPRATYGRTNGDFFFSSRCAGKKQIGYVGARDQ